MDAKEAWTIIIIDDEEKKKNKYQKVTNKQKNIVNAVAVIAATEEPKKNKQLNNNNYIFINVFGSTFWYLVWLLTLYSWIIIIINDIKCILYALHIAYLISNVRCPVMMK